MDQVQAFFIGFVIAGVIGWLSSLLLKSWTIRQKTQKRMFSSIPNPALKPLPGSINKVIGTDPDRSPLWILSSGCLTIILQLLLQIGLLVVMGIIIWFVLQINVSSGAFLGGVLFAAMMGFLLQRTRLNWKKITNHYKLITNRPSPSLNNVNSPNNHYVAAKPTLPPFDILVNGVFEIGWRTVWQVILLFLLYQSISVAYFYLSDEVIRFSRTIAFGGS